MVFYYCRIGSRPIDCTDDQSEARVLDCHLIPRTAGEHGVRGGIRFAHHLLHDERAGARGPGGILAIALLLIARRTGLLSGAPLAVGLLTLAFVLGAILTVVGNVRANAWLLRSHIAAAVIGTLALIPYVWKRGNDWPQFRKASRSHWPCSWHCRLPGTLTADTSPIPTTAS